jgi:hypothetical protein
MEAAVGAGGLPLGQHPMAQRAAAKIGSRRHQLQQIGGLFVI